MSIDTQIEWTQATWSPIVGCSKITPQCNNCYAIKTINRLAHNPNKKLQEANKDLVIKTADGSLNWTGKVNLLFDRLQLPLKWKTPKRIFVNSQSDLFHDQVGFNFTYKIFEIMSLANWHTFQILTKRPIFMRHMIEEVYFHLHRNYPMLQLPLPNVWLGVSAGQQKYIDKFLLELLETQAAVRFLSAEPLLEEIDLEDYLYTYEKDSNKPSTQKLDWVIVGGESGTNPRPMLETWVLKLQQQCEVAKVPFFYKQAILNKKKVSLPLLNGKQWAEMPESKV